VSSLARVAKNDTGVAGNLCLGEFNGNDPKYLREILSTGYISTEISTHWPLVYAPQLNWYAIYTRPSHEKRSIEHLALREIECYLPSYRTTRRWKNRCTVELQLPLFPSYVFARFPWCEHVRVLEIPGVLSIVGSGREPLPLRHSEIVSLREGLDLRRAEPHPYLNVGERARIRSGPLAGFQGIVMRKNNGLRVILTLQEIMKSVAVEVEEYDLEPIGDSSGYLNTDLGKT
jgi:transcription antitermination factor NusG